VKAEVLPPGVTRRGDGRYQAYYRDALNVRKSVIARTADDCVALRDLKVLQVQQGLPTLKSDRLTVSQWVQEWFDFHLEGRADRTVKGYTEVMTAYVLPTIGTIRLDDLTDTHLDLLFRDLRDERKLSGTSRALVYRTLRASLNRAVKKKRLAANPLLLIDAPRKDSARINPWTVDEINTFLDSIRGDRFEALFTLTLLLGLRQSEVLGLRWDDIDLDNYTVTINGTLGRDKVWRARAKTDASMDTLRLTPRLVELLRTHKARQAQEKFRWNKRWTAVADQNPGLAFVSKFGGPIQHHNVNKAFKRRLEAAGLRHQRFHDLRHMSASLIRLQGGSLEEIGHHLRHTDKSSAPSLYAHWYDEQRQVNADRMDALFPARKAATS